MALDAIAHMLNNSTLDEKGTCDTPRRVGRRMEYPEKREAAFKPGTLDRIQGALRDDETQVGFIREAVERELERRAKG